MQAVEKFLFRRVVAEIVSHQCRQCRGSTRIILLLFDNVLIAKFFHSMARIRCPDLVLEGETSREEDTAAEEQDRQPFHDESLISSVWGR